MSSCRLVPGAVVFLLLLPLGVDAQTATPIPTPTITPALGGQYVPNTATVTPTGTKTGTPTRTPTVTQTRTVTSTSTITRTPTVAPTVVEQKCLGSDWSKNTSTLENIPGLAVTRVVTQSANSYFALLQADIHNTRAETVQVALKITESPTGITTSQVVDVNPGANRVVQLPYKFLNLSLGTHTFTPSVNQGSSGPLYYQSDTTCLGVWDVSYETQIINQLREIYWPAAAMQYDGTHCTHPQGGLIDGYHRSWYIICEDSADSYLFGDIKLPTVYADTNISFSIEGQEMFGNTGTIAFEVWAYCAGENKAHGAPSLSPSAGTATATISVAQPTQWSAETGAITPTGDCATDPHLYWSIRVDAANTTVDMSQLAILGVRGNWNP